MTYASTTASAAIAFAFTSACFYRFMIMILQIQDYFEDSVAGTFDHA